MRTKEKLCAVSVCVCDCDVELTYIAHDKTEWTEQDNSCTDPYYCESDLKVRQGELKVDYTVI